MSDETLATRDEVERFKAYIEIAKYAISICIALAAVCGLIIRISVGPDGVPLWQAIIFSSGILLNIFLFFVSHRVVSEAAKGITHKMMATDRENLLREINGSSYSFFVIVFVGNLIFWSISIGLVTI